MNARLNIHQGPLTSQTCHQGPVAAGVGVDRGLADKKTAFRFHTRTSGFNFLALAGHSPQITGGQAEVMTSVHVWTFRNYYTILPEVAFRGNHHSSAREHSLSSMYSKEYLLSNSSSLFIVSNYFASAYTALQYHTILPSISTDL